MKIYYMKLRINKGNQEGGKEVKTRKLRMVRSEEKSGPTYDTR
jgi:hypothetical protein